MQYKYETCFLRFQIDVVILVIVKNIPKLFQVLYPPRKDCEVVTQKGGGVADVHKGLFLKIADSEKLYS
jgi:hypothetical protein